MTVKTNNFQIGVDATADNNFTLTTPAVPDGTAKLARGNAGATTHDIITVAADGAVSIETTIPDTDNSKKAVTSAWAKLGFAILLAANGYIKFPSWMGGLIVQWGNTVTSATPGAGTVVTFPLAYPSVVRGIFMQNHTSTASGLTLFAGNATQTQFTQSASQASISVSWLSIGY